MTDILELGTVKFESDLFNRECEDNEKFCSCCLTGGELINMENNVENDGKKESYVNVINQCFNAQVLNDSYVKLHYICSICIQRLMDTSAFKSQVIEAQRTLLNFFKAEDNSRDLDRKLGSVTHIKDLFEEDASDGRSGIGENSFDNCFNQSEDYSECELDKLLSSKKIPKSKAVSKRKSRFKAKPKVSRRGFVAENVTGRLLTQQQTNDMYASMDTENMQCKECLKKFQSLHILRRHMNEHFINYTCEKCGKGFATIQRYFAHMRVHQTGSFKCLICAKTFDTVSKLDSHRANHRSSLYKCRHCKMRFKSYYTRQKHMYDEHTAVGGYTCGLCPKICITLNMLKVHTRRQHSQRARAHACHLCDKEFYDKQTLASHMIVHTGVKSYSCTECKKAYARKKTLIQHMKIHNNVRDHVCADCGQAFVQKCSLKWHLRKHNKAEADLQKSLKGQT